MFPFFRVPKRKKRRGQEWSSPCATSLPLYHSICSYTLRIKMLINQVVSSY